MTAPERDVRLPERAEALLDGWPVPSRSALEWEDAASAVMARVAHPGAEETSDDLLAAPLPAEDGEGSLAVEPALDEPGLVSIARAVVEAEHTASQREVARDVLTAAEHGRRVIAPARRDAETAALQSHVQRPGQPVHAAAPPGARRAPEPRHHVVEVTAHSELPGPGARPRRESGFAAGMFGGAALALAACAALYISVRHRDAEPVVAAPSAEAARAVAVASQPAAPQASAPSEPLAVTTMEDLPSAADSPLAAKRASGSAPAPAPKTLSFRVKGAASPDSDEKLVLEEPTAANAAPAPKEQSLGKVAQKAAPAQAPQAEAVSPQPSLGAVQGALGAVMGGARSCLAGQDTGSKASITFGSDGHVKAVAVSGPAAGSPAESCLRSALMAARVPPFSEPSFSASLTVRPP